jgi:DNA-binding FadR family transcriptional regulator
MQGRGRDALASHLLDEIMSGRWPVGTKLPPERHLAQSFGLSRPIVREVLRGLQERGLIEVAVGQGSFVRAPSTTDGARSLQSYYQRRNATAHEVMDARLMLETTSARLAALNADETELAALRRTLEDCENAENVVDGARLDLAFHGLLARASKNPMIDMMFASIAGYTFELMLRSHADPEVLRHGLPLHRRIADAVERRAPEAAEQAMREHLTLASTMYGEDYERSVDNVARRLTHGSDISLEDLLDEVTRRAVTGERLTR